MAAQDLFTDSLEPNPLECWDDESTASALRALAVWLHSMGISPRETAAALEQFGVTRSHQAVFQWVHRTAETAPDPPTAKPSRVAVDETAVKIGTEQRWLYAAIDVETKLLLGAVVSERRGTDPAAAFLGRLAEKHDFSETTFLVDGMGYLTALARTSLSGDLNYTERNIVEKLFQTYTMRIGRFHETWNGSQASAERWLTAYTAYYNHHRSHQALENQTPIDALEQEGSI